MKQVFISYSRIDISLYHVLADVLESEGMTVFRADRLPNATNLPGEVFSAIRQCDVFVALLSDAHANVMLELGYALGSSKRVLLIAGPEQKIPFDVASFPLVRVDRFDPRSLSEAIEQVRTASSQGLPAQPRASDATSTLRQIIEDPLVLDQLSSREFEQIVAGYLSDLGLNVELMPPRHEGGFDILLPDVCDPPGAIVEVKKHSRNSRTSVNDVQRIVGSAVVFGAPAAILITSADFTSSARFFAETAPLPIVLLTIEQVIDATRDSITRSLRAT